MDLTLPLDYAAIERILPHRYPFLLVDRITEFEMDKRIVGIKNVSLNERYLSHATNGAPVLPPTILTEAVAQVGAILILAKPENRQRLPFFAGIERVRYRRPVLPATWWRSRRSCSAAQPDGPAEGRRPRRRQRVVEGTMTFALDDPSKTRVGAAPLPSGSRKPWNRRSGARRALRVPHHVEHGCGLRCRGDSVRVPALA